MMYSMNPYAGCEHGCIYCYARNVHEYWGYSAGLDFERKIIVKKNAPEMLRKFLMHPNGWRAPDHVKWQYRLLSARRANLPAHQRIA
jgi:DNA repair photolyase